MKMEELLEVNDIYFLGRRLLEIDPLYKLMFSRTDNKFLILHNNQVVFSLNKDEINPSLILKVRQSRREYMNLLFKQIDEHNLKLQKCEDERISDDASLKLNYLLGIASHTSSELSNKDMIDLIS
ncbi:MAG: hypothetical protein RR334_02145 [Clostridia bacterium]